MEMLPPLFGSFLEVILLVGGGATQQLLDFLTQNGIQYVIH